MADTELLPCPFCGGAARHLSQRIGFWSERVICDTCDYWVRPEVWAGRATPPSPSTAPEVKRWRAWKDRGAALASRPAEVDDEGLPALPEPAIYEGTGDGLPDLFTAEQYRQGQRDAVAADRARRGATGK